MKAPDPLLRTRDPELQDWVDRCNLILNSGKYEFFVTNQTPTERANQGEQKVYSSDDGTSRAFYVYINGVWCAINFDSSGGVVAGGNGSYIADTDGNTLVHTEFTGNEDRVRIYTNGTYVAAYDTYGFQVASEYKIVLNGLGGDTYWTYSTASSYMQCYVSGVLRMEM